MKTVFVMFEVGRSNVGDARTRIRTSKLLAEWNTALDSDGVTVVAAVGHTGNYIVETAEKFAVGEFERLFRGVGVKVAAFAAAEFGSWAIAATSALAVGSHCPPGRRTTAGVVMDLNAKGGIPQSPPDSDRVTFAAFAAPRVRGVWKLDLLRSDGRALDRAKREGGWGSIATEMTKHATWKRARVLSFT